MLVSWWELRLVFRMGNGGDGMRVVVHGEDCSGQALYVVAQPFRGFLQFLYQGVLEPGCS
jgi:hypothetical protein